jgi:hypothetical protein
MRDHALSEHKTLKDILSDIDAMKVASPGFGDKLEILMVVSTPAGGWASPAQQQHMCWAPPAAAALPQAIQLHAAAKFRQ